MRLSFFWDVEEAYLRHAALRDEGNVAVSASKTAV